MALNITFAEGEKVLCFHGPALYEAKITHIVKEKEILYHVHYKGWNKRRDEWVGDERIVKHDEAGLQQQRELKHKLSGKRRPSSGTPGAKMRGPKGTPKVTSPPLPPGPKVSPSVTKAASTTDKDSVSRSSTPSIDRPSSKHEISSDTVAEGSRRRKQKVEVTVETEEPVVARVEIAIQLPYELKPVLIDDWVFVNKQKMLFQLPAERNIEAILNDYFEAKVAKDKDSADAVLEITKGIRSYFNALLSTHLLYKFERIQHRELLTEYKDKQPIDVYGSVHLLRLCVKIGNMLADTDIDDRSRSLLITHIQDFLKWMSKNMSTLTLFSPTYYFSAPADYRRKALLL